MVIQIDLLNFTTLAGMMYTLLKAQELVESLGPNYCDLDKYKFVAAGYNYEMIFENAQNYDYFQFNAPDFTNDILIGISNGFSGHDDSKWEIVIGGWTGTIHVIRDGNSSPLYGLVKKQNPNR